MISSPQTAWPLVSKQHLSPEQKMEMEELSPLAQASLTPVQGTAEEDDGFVDILESDLKVEPCPARPMSPLAGSSHGEKIQAPRASLASFQCQRSSRLQSQV